MRLIQRKSASELRLTNDLIGNDMIPRYAILSHTWEEGQEVTFHDFINGAGEDKNGYKKLQFCAERSTQAGLEHFWVDTCCIDKSNSTELQEAITSMFRWYSNAEICFVYLSDVDDLQRWKWAFRRSRWFTRGWTLQELLAPSHVEFYSRNGDFLGTKRSLEETIHEVTQISFDALRGQHLSGFSRDERMSWADKRETKREEDAAYSLLGMFDVCMPLIYGEGRKSALKRLEDHIVEKQREKALEDARMKRKKEEEEERQRIRKMLKNSLPFNQMNARQSTIKIAHARTCEWLLYEPEYIQWLDSTKFTKHRGLLWIKGKPGAGKSTLMKYALSQFDRTPDNFTAISFFFNARGESLEHSILGTYRSLLWQIMESFPETLSVLDAVVLGMAGLNQAIATLPWNIEILQGLLSQVIYRLAQKSILCFIDALDECEEEQIRDMIRFLEHLGALAVSCGVSLRICLSSRHYPHITIRYGLTLNLDALEGHSRDIKVYLSTSLKIERSQLAHDIRARIQARAAGVFMWVVLVVALLNKEYDHGRIHRLQQRLEEIPSGLHELFHETLTRDTNNSEETILCIQWLLFARELLAPRRLYHAILSSTEPEALSESNLAMITGNDIERFILSSSKGLAEVITVASGPRVQFIHESVKDYLTRPKKIGTVWPSLDHNFEGQSHEQLKQCCLKYLSMAVFDNSDRWKYTDRTILLTNAFPFLKYAIANVMHHAEAAARSGIDQRNFIRDFPLSKWIKYYNLCMTDKYSKDTNLLYLLAERDLSSLVRVHPSNLLHLGKEENVYQCPLVAAIGYGSKEVLQDFIRTHAATLSPESTLRERCENYLRCEIGFLPSTFTGYYTSAIPKPTSLIYYLVELGNDVLLALVLHARETGIISLNVDAPDGNGRWTPLILSVHLRYLHITRILLETKQVNVNASSAMGRTPLMIATSNGDEAMVKMLLESGQVDVELKDSLGLTALMMAREGGNRKIVEWLTRMENQV